MDNSVCFEVGSQMFASLSQSCSLNTVYHIWPEINYRSFKRMILTCKTVQAFSCFLKEARQQSIHYMAVDYLLFEITQ